MRDLSSRERCRLVVSAVNSPVGEVDGIDRASCLPRVVFLKTRRRGKDSLQGSENRH